MKKTLLALAVIILFVGCEKETVKLRTPGIGTAELLSDKLGFALLNDGYTDRIQTKESFEMTVLTCHESEIYANNYFGDRSEAELQAKSEWIESLKTNGLNQYRYSYYDNPYRSFYYAGILEGSKIYADTVLWGRAPGEDLGDMFAISFRYFNDLVATYPDFYVLYGPGDEYPKTFRELTSNRIALNNIVIAILSFAEIPPENFDTLTLTVEIPIEVDYFFDYPAELFDKYPVLKPEGRRLLKGSYTIKFYTT